MRREPPPARAQDARAPARRPREQRPDRTEYGPRRRACRAASSQGCRGLGQGRPLVQGEAGFRAGFVVFATGLSHRTEWHHVPVW
ncbi:hypothetical protein [Lysobacter gummosus]|uniref:hypothetical protein n=1 Tax=Lysobacter gummosus TaxID=262324 RepID=UPI00362EF20C